MLNKPKRRTSRQQASLQEQASPYMPDVPGWEQKDKNQLKSEDVNQEWHLKCIMADTEFARNEFLEINREQMRLRIISVSVIGLVASVLFPLFATTDRSDTLILGSGNFDLNSIVGTSLLMLSLFYAVLTLIYINLGGRRSTLVKHLAIEVKISFREVNNTLCNFTTSLDPELSGKPRIAEISRRIWTLCQLSIFVGPCLFFLTLWASYFHSMFLMHIYLCLILSLGVALMLIASSIQWLFYHPEVREWLGKTSERVQRLLSKIKSLTPLP
jgi:hypothetical protein